MNADLHTADTLISTTFSVITFLSFGFIVVYGLRLPHLSSHEVANSVVRDPALAIFYVAMILMASFLLLKFGLILTALSTIAMASFTAAGLSWMTKRADRILAGRGWAR